MSAVLGAWSVKGVDEEAKAIAKRSAAESGITMGAWLEAAIMHIAKGGVQQDVEKTLQDVRNLVQSPDMSMDRADLTAPNIVASEKRLFNTTIRIAPQNGAQNSPFNPAGLAAIADSVNDIEQALQSSLGQMQMRILELENSMQQVRNLLPAPGKSAPAMLTASTDLYAMTDISAEYHPLALPPASTETSLFGNSKNAETWDDLLTLAVIVALGVAAFLAGNRLGFDFVNF